MRQFSQILNLKSTAKLKRCIPVAGKGLFFDRKERKEKRDKTRDLSLVVFVFFAISAVKSSSWVEKGAFEGQTLPCRLCESSFMPAASFYQRLVYGSMPMNHREARNAFS
jgi:hypothetical protein